jgi:hypothetical protein
VASIRLQYTNRLTYLYVQYRLNSGNVTLGQPMGSFGLRGSSEVRVISA